MVDFAQRVYAAAANVPGMLAEAVITPAGGVPLPAVKVGYFEPDEMVLGNEVISAQPAIKYATADLPNLAKRDGVTVGGKTYKVAQIQRLGDGSESRATLEK